MSSINSLPLSIPSLTGVVSPPEPLDPNEGLCLLTRDLATRAPVEPTHLFRIPRRNPGMQTTVEYALGLPYNTLNIDDPRNIFQLKVDWRRLFDENRWLLLPSMELVKCLLDGHKINQDITTLYDDARTFRYRFVPFGQKRIMTMIRYPRMTADADPDADETFERIEYPFRSLPELESHIYPHWAILNAGRKLHGIGDRGFYTLAIHAAEAYKVPISKGMEFIKNIQVIYERWTNAVVPNTFTGLEVVSSSTSDGSSALVPHTSIGLEVVPSLTDNGSSADKPSTSSWSVRSTKRLIAFFRGKKDQRRTTGA